jgi:hypothetical protein
MVEGNLVVAAAQRRYTRFGSNHIGNERDAWRVVCLRFRPTTLNDKADPSKIRWLANSFLVEALAASLIFRNSGSSQREASSMSIVSKRSAS